MVELANLVEADKEFKDIRNGVYQQNGRSIFNDMRQLKPDLDKLPFADFTFADEFNVSVEGNVQANDSM